MTKVIVSEVSGKNRAERVRVTIRGRVSVMVRVLAALSLQESRYEGATSMVVKSEGAEGNTRVISGKKKPSLAAK